MAAADLCPLLLHARCLPVGGHLGLHAASGTCPPPRHVAISPAKPQSLQCCLQCLCAARRCTEAPAPACRAALLTVYSAEALLLAFALKLKVSAAVAGEGRPALNSARPFRGGANAAQWDRAAGFLGSCMPQMQPLRGGRKPLQSSGFKVGCAIQLAGADSG